MKIIFTTLIIGLVSIFQSIAAKKDSNAKSYVDRITGEIFKIVSNKNTPLDQQKKIILQNFIDEIDFEWNGRAAAGRLFKEMTDDQKVSFIKNYKDFLIKIWMPRFNGYNGEKYVVEQAEQINEKDSIIKIKITTATQGSNAISLDLKIRDYGDYFKILNVGAEGMDMAKNYSSQFQLYADKYGIDELINYLKTGVQKQ